MARGSLIGGTPTGPRRPERGLRELLRLGRGQAEGAEGRAARFRSRKDSRQSIRFTANARFRLLGNGRLRLPKIGDVRVRWSRPPPSVLSSVTVIRDAAGRFFASFVVEASDRPLPTTDAECGIDLGLTHFAVQALARTRLAKSVHDAGWSAFVAMLEYKARLHGRQFRKIGRFEPTSQVCSSCGARDGPKPLHVRAWQCAACGAVHDRDVNAAKNIAALGRREAQNAHGGQARPAATPAPAGETGSRRGAA